MVWPHGETALVTGAASGIGLGIARALVAAGAKVALADVNGARLADVERELSEAGGTVLAVKLDVSDAEGWKAAADRVESALGPVSILCNNAGTNGGSALAKTPIEVWRWVNRVNLEGQFIGISTFVPRFENLGRRAHIINTASMAGLTPMRDQGAYVASKWGSIGMSLVLRDELEGTDIGVSVLCPGSVATQLGENMELAQAELLGREPNYEIIERNQAGLGMGADPDRVGEQVVEAMQKRQFLVITHREWEPLMLRVHHEFQRTFAEFDGRHGVDKIPGILLSGENPVST
ncbi:SDR family NAD(P)-dependent oxidoreductase [Nocardia sp. NPDC004711]